MLAVTNRKGCYYRFTEFILKIHTLIMLQGKQATIRCIVCPAPASSSALMGGLNKTTNQ